MLTKFQPITLEDAQRLAVVIIFVIYAIVLYPLWFQPGTFRWYRRWRGGSWARVSGWFWGKRWIRISNEFDFEMEEFWGYRAR